MVEFSTTKSTLLQRYIINITVYVKNNIKHSQPLHVNILMYSLYSNAMLNTALHSKGVLKDRHVNKRSNCRTSSYHTVYFVDVYLFTLYTEEAK